MDQRLCAGHRFCLVPGPLSIQPLFVPGNARLFPFNFCNSQLRTFSVLSKLASNSASTVAGIKTPRFFRPVFWPSVIATLNPWALFYSVFIPKVVIKRAKGNRDFFPPVRTRGFNFPKLFCYAKSSSSLIRPRCDNGHW